MPRDHLSEECLGEGPDLAGGVFSELGRPLQLEQMWTEEMREWSWMGTLRDCGMDFMKGL